MARFIAHSHFLWYPFVCYSYSLWLIIMSRLKSPCHACPSMTYTIDEGRDCLVGVTCSFRKFNSNSNDNDDGVCVTSIDCSLPLHSMLQNQPNSSLLINRFLFFVSLSLPLTPLLSLFKFFICHNIISCVCAP